MSYEGKEVGNMIRERMQYERDMWTGVESSRGDVKG